MANHLSRNEILLAEQIGRDQASTLLDYDGTRGEFIFDSNRMSALQAGVALKAYLLALAQEWDDERLDQHLADLLDPASGALDRLRTWIRYQSIAPLVEASMIAPSAQQVWARMVNQIKSPVLDLLLVAQMEQGSPGTGDLALSTYPGFADWLVKGLGRKAGQLGSSKKYMQRARQEGMVEIAWACALAGNPLNPRSDWRRHDILLLVEGLTRLDDKTFNAIAARITIEQMEKIGHSITEALAKQSGEHAQTLEQGWSNFKSSRLRQFAGKAKAHSPHVRKM